MPKGNAPRSGKNTFVATKTWGGTPLKRTKAQLEARTKNVLRENFPSASQYKADKAAAATRKDIRSEGSVSRIKKMKAPVGKGGR